MASKYPLRGEGIEIRENTKESSQERRKYNIHIDEQLFVEMIEKHNEWERNPETRRRVFGYEATDEGYQAARTDDKCPSG